MPLPRRSRVLARSALQAVAKDAKTSSDFFTSSSHDGSKRRQRAVNRILPVFQAAIAHSTDAAGQLKAARTQHRSLCQVSAASFSQIRDALSKWKAEPTVWGPLNAAVVELLRDAQSFVQDVQDRTNSLVLIPEAARTAAVLRAESRALRLLHQAFRRILESLPDTALSADQSRPRISTSGRSAHATRGKSSQRPRSGVRRTTISPAARQHLLEWLWEHKHHPYPDDDARSALSEATGIPVEQVSNWFSNARAREWRPKMLADGYTIHRDHTGRMYAQAPKKSQRNDDDDDDDDACDTRE